ncbi:hypothetical protein ABK040_011469 [Willaertia magna]
MNSLQHLSQPPIGQKQLLTEVSCSTLLEPIHLFENKKDFNQSFIYSFHLDKNRKSKEFNLQSNCFFKFPKITQTSTFKLKHFSAHLKAIIFQSEENEIYFYTRPSSNEQFTEHYIKFFKNIKQLSCGYDFFILLTSDGEIYSWGKNSFSQLGYVTLNENIVKTPFKISLDDKIIEKISCGSIHTIILTTEHELYGFGDNEEGQLGLPLENEENSEFENYNKPTKINVRHLDENDEIVDIICGSWTSFFISKLGKVYVCGDQSPYLHDRSVIKEHSKIQFINNNYSSTTMINNNNHYINDNNIDNNKRKNNKILIKKLISGAYYTLYLSLDNTCYITNSTCLELQKIMTNVTNFLTNMDLCIFQHEEGNIYILKENQWIEISLHSHWKRNLKKGYYKLKGGSSSDCFYILFDWYRSFMKRKRKLFFKKLKFIKEELSDVIFNF